MGISVRDTEEEAKRFVADKGLTFANGCDPNLTIARAFQVETTPTTFFITSGGQILNRHSGAFTEQQFTETLQTLLDYKAP